MGDRATIAFLNAASDGEIDEAHEVARVYIHNAGSRANEILNLFFEEENRAIEAGTQGSRFDDPSYLAARFVRWHMSPDGCRVGVVGPHWAERYHWTVTCGGKAVRPLVRRLLPPPIETINDFGFGIGGGSGDDAVIAPMLPVGQMNRAKALRTAAWLALIADPQGDDFAAVLEAVKST